MFDLNGCLAGLLSVFISLFSKEQNLCTSNNNNGIMKRAPFVKRTYCFIASICVCSST